MARKIQKRTLETRARLLAVATELAAENGYEAMRIEDIVSRAGVAKGTFFAHFRDKDLLMDHLIGARLHQLLDALAEAPAPRDTAGVIAALAPLHDAMTSERYVIDIILRYSGAAAVTEIGPISLSFGRYLAVTTKWFTADGFRRDIPAELMAEGLQAFAMQAMALTFCALHQEQSRDARLRTYLDAWLTPA
ncbi:MAG: TetR/AcrR family transcriptional regulator [Pseudomonadota bacterium]